MPGISKRGDAYLRTLLIHGARSVVTGSRQPTGWVTSLSWRRPANVAVVALANKMARTIWDSAGAKGGCPRAGHRS